MARNDLVLFHMQRQGGRCSICGEDISQMDRWAIRVDRYPVKGKDGGAYTEENTRLICLDCDWKQEDNPPRCRRPDIRAAYERYRLWLQIAGDFGRRQKAISGQAANTNASPYLDPEELLNPIEEFEALAKESEKALRKLMRTQAEWKGFMKAAPGMSELTAAFILSHIDIDIADTPSKIWRYLGLDPSEKYNPGKGKMRAPLYAALSISLIRNGSKYRADYDAYKADGVSHGGAIRRLMKKWLAHLYETWRAWEGLSVRPPYAHRDGSDFLPATAYGWPEVRAKASQ